LDITMDQQLLTALSIKTTYYTKLPVWNELHAITNNELNNLEQELAARNNLRFEYLYNEPIGYFFIKTFLEIEHSIDKAIFIQDVIAFKAMRHLKERKETMHKIFDTFCVAEPENRVKGTSCLTNRASIKRKSLQVFNVEISHHEMSKSSMHLPELSDTSDIERAEINSPRDLDSDSDGADGHMPQLNEMVNLTNLSKKLLDTVQLEQICLESESRSMSKSRNERRASMTSLNHMLSNKKTRIPRGQNIDSRPRSKSQQESQSDSRGRLSSFFSENANVIGCQGKHVRKLKERISAGHCDTDIFDKVLKQILNDLKLDAFPRFMKSQLFQMYLRCKMLEKKSITLSCFRPMRMLGRGAFGTVNACRKRDTGRLYAMKQINKGRVQATDSIDAVMSERDFLSRMDSIFVTSLKYAFTTSDRLYLIMDLMTGGDLKFHLNQCGKFEENRCRFYAAQILLGIEHIHSKGIIYRDLKLENVLVDGRGHIKISDLGLAVLITDNPRGYAGTPGYTAPEVVLTQYYDEKVDFFSFGVLVYRTLCGKKPFEKKKGGKDGKRVANSSVELDRNVVEMFPRFDNSAFTSKTRNICRGLLCKNARDRLGEQGFDEIKRHPWFACIDWNMLESGLLVSPYTPPHNEINAERAKYIGKPENNDKYGKVKISKELNHALKDFEFKSSKVIQSEIVVALRKIYDERSMSGKYEECADPMELYKFPPPHMPEIVAVGPPRQKENCLQCVIA